MFHRVDAKFAFSLPYVLDILNGREFLLLDRHWHAETQPCRSKVATPRRVVTTLQLPLKFLLILDPDIIDCKQLPPDVQEILE